ncbi:MAG: VOC family protein [Actinomycetota bacterium]
MSLKFDFLTIDCQTPLEVGRFWEQALPAYELEFDDDAHDPDEVVLLPADKRGPKMLFQKVADDVKMGKNRLHFDLRPETDRDAEVTRLEELGAKRIDIGQGDVTWTVMADPFGNEFCVLRPLTDEEKEKWANWAW